MLYNIAHKLANKINKLANKRCKIAITAWMMMVMWGFIWQDGLASSQINLQ